MTKIRAAIAGGTGYTAGELIRILINHPEIEISSILSTSSVGTSISTIHRDLFGETDMKFTDKLMNPDVLFLCLGHGLSREFIDSHTINEKCKIIDLGNDFRLSSNYKDREYIYGLCELNHKEIEKSSSVSNPGCFATAIQLGIIPLCANGMIKDDIHVHAVTGSTGAGKKLTETGQFSYRTSNFSVYKPFTHQHLDEINKTVFAVSGESPQINFVPMRGDFTRGIFTSIYTKCDYTADKIEEMYKEYYSTSPFVHISEEPISLKEVINTNKCLIHIESHNGYIHITTIIDNLVKGASGQAVQNMNLMFGLEENMGLKLKPTAF
jgi:N-acetyl-gamma-glutamyl-phosphate reductase